MRYRLRTLLIALALGPPLLAGAWLAGGTILPTTTTVICFVAIVSAMATLTTDNG